MTQPRPSVTIRVERPGTHKRVTEHFNVCRIRMHADGAFDVIATGGKVVARYGPYAETDLILYHQEGAERLQRLRAQNPRAGRPWTDAETQRLYELDDRGLTDKEKSAEMDRSVGAIRSRLSRRPVP